MANSYTRKRFLGLSWLNVTLLALFFIVAPLVNWWFSQQPLDWVTKRAIASGNPSICYQVGTVEIRDGWASRPIDKCLEALAPTIRDIKQCDKLGIVGSPDIRTKCLQAAGGGTMQQYISICTKLEYQDDQNKAGQCYAEIAIHELDNSYCEKTGNQISRAYCYQGLAHLLDPAQTQELCKKITGYPQILQDCMARQIPAHTTPFILFEAK